jgi:hypothetical protein
MRRRPYDEPRFAGPQFTLGLQHGHSVVEGLAAAIDFFEREDQVRHHYERPSRNGAVTGIYARFEVHPAQ